MLHNSISPGWPLSTSDGALQAPDDGHGALPLAQRASTIVPIASIRMHSKTSVCNETR